MKIAPSAVVHPTAILSDEVEIGENTRVGPYAVLEGPIRLGANCRVGPHVHLLGHLTAGNDNAIGTGSVIGSPPQHLGYAGAETRVVIGDGNAIREHVTIHGSFLPDAATALGSGCFLMANSHVGHDAVLGDRCVLVNGALVGGHARVGERAMLSGNSAVHQFGAVGTLALLSGCATATKDVPPFSISCNRNEFGGVNIVGMRRAGYDAAAINAVRRAYRTIYFKGLTIKYAAALIEQEMGHIGAIAELVDFIRTAKRGIAGGLRPGKGVAEAEAA